MTFFSAGLLTGFRLTADLQTSFADQPSNRSNGGQQSNAIQDCDNSESLHLRANPPEDDPDVSESDSTGSYHSRSDQSRSTNEPADEDSDLESGGLIQSEDDDSGSGQDSDLTEGASEEEDEPDTKRYSSKRMSAPASANDKANFKSRPCEREDTDLPQRQKKKRARAPSVGSSNSTKVLKAASRNYKNMVSKDAVKRKKEVAANRKHKSVSKGSKKGRLPSAR